MGSRKTTSTQTNKPIYGAQIQGAASSQQAAYDAQAPKIGAFSDSLLGASGDLLAQARAGNPAVNAAQGYITDTLGSDPANNPQLENIIAQTGQNVLQKTMTGLGTRGLNGGSVAAKIASRQLAENESGLRYQDYNNQQQRRAQAAGMAPGVAAGALAPYAAAAGIGQTGSMLPLQASLANSAGIGGLLGQYQTVNGVQKQSPGFLDILGTGIQAASLFSDRRLKTDIRRVGATDEGTPVYVYRYGGQGPFHMGVMADEAPASALGPVVDGFQTVNYGAL